MQRTSGVLMHITSLPNDYGIGSFGQEAYHFVDFLQASKQSYWQILPLTTTSYGDSPYQSFSAFAGNTHLIDLDLLVSQGYLHEDDLRDLAAYDDLDQVDYAFIFYKRRPVLEKAVANFRDQEGTESLEFKTFISDNANWLDPFVEYMTVKENFDLNAWYEWPDKYKYYQEAIINDFMAEHQDQADYHYVTQFWFFQQWQALKSYANQKGIQIIGDIPIYVAADSVEMWQTPELFRVDDAFNPIDVSGVPPDAFTADGQYWGNPIYDWEYMQKTGYQWWIQRISESFKLYDVVRIDHFRGFESFWSVPFGSPTAAYGRWEKGPGNDLFDHVEAALGELNIIAEDLGYMTQEVIDMREATCYPGMKILQFGFNNDPNNQDLPHHYSHNTVAYVGTHDNETAEGWYQDTASQAERDQVDAYLNRRSNETASQALNRGIAASVSDVAIYQMQDLLGLGNEARMNTPSTIGQNWKWRMRPGAIDQELVDYLKQLTEIYCRKPEDQ
ncbi:4-alpha-glucanotransferase [Aerococcus kribbianus]|uniref:4-alpha-glucanotransferase n=1 Tax=Aerococcus kribbianus TaxID=2999064 RepID=A0A9X3FNI7_9LACT|nr:MULTISPECIES: 4-alpha-glucanotransferase [unclassified Aerococcus]MCZ0716866.1 4-alpha-glucanotransferase [Aerococcus sp. YH-aer221]MCZ0725154.1 4-alpha-glucanotransferase [Aerococcus sp. YH-aer222]